MALTSSIHIVRVNTVEFWFPNSSSVFSLDELDSHDGEVGEILVEHSNLLVLGGLLGGGGSSGGNGCSGSRSGRGGSFEELTRVGDFGFEFSLELFDCKRRRDNEKRTKGQ